MTKSKGEKTFYTIKYFTNIVFSFKIETQPESFFITPTLTNQLPSTPKLKNFNLSGSFTTLDYDAYWKFLRANVGQKSFGIVMFNVESYNAMNKSFLEAFPNCPKKDTSNEESNRLSGEEYILDQTNVRLFYYH